MEGAKEIKSVERLDAVFTAPPSKAHTLRALFMASLAEGKSVLRNALNAEDQKAAAKALASYGAGIRFDGKNFIVHGTGGKMRAPSETVYTADSGVTTRFIIPVAALAEGVSVIDGSERMRERPVAELVEALEKVGVEAEILGSAGCIPVKVKGGTFKGGSTSVQGKESSQFLSAMLIAAPYTEKGLLAGVEGELKSRPYVDITLECMAAFGVNAVNRNYKEFFVRGNSKYRAGDYAIEGDYSSASYFFAAAAVTGGKAKVENLNPYSKQGDKFFLECLEKMGCSVSNGKNFVEVRGGKMKGITVSMADYPDIVPTLAVVAAFADGKTTITGVEHLALKESNRLESTAKNLRKCGIPAVAGPDYLEVVGKKGSARGAEIDTFNDHRIAMAFAVMGLAVAGIRIKNPEVVAKSFPEFFKELEKAYGGAE